jgi:Bacterial self-protective colicin-like immunity
MSSPNLDEWIALIARFVDGSIPADEFATAYFSLEQRAFDSSGHGQAASYPGDADRILYDLFVKIDRLSNARQLGDGDLTEHEFRDEAATALSKLRQIADDPSSGRPSAVTSGLRLTLASIFIVGGAIAFAGYAVWRPVRWLGLKAFRH